MLCYFYHISVAFYETMCTYFEKLVHNVLSVYLLETQKNNTMIMIVKNKFSIFFRPILLPKDVENSLT